MKTAIRLSILLLIISMTSSCSSGKKLSESDTVILPLSGSVTLKEGSIVYGLPRTVFTVVVELERTIEKPGPYAQFASDLLGLNNVIQSESESWSIGGVKVITHEELDPSEFYVIESNTLFQTNVLALKKEGLILDINPELFYSSENKPRASEQGINQFRSSDLGSDEYFLMQRDTAYKRVTVDSAFIRLPYIVEKKKKLPVDQLAERAAKRLMEMREGKHLILTGEANVFPQSDAPIIEINRLEKEYTELFTGKIWTETSTIFYQIIPEKKMVGKPVILGYFSDRTGPVDATTKGGMQLTLELIPEQKTKDLNIINKKPADPDNTAFDKLYYRIPDVVNLKITLGTEQLLNSRRLIYQFGQVVQLPANYIIGK